jgi:hypothetical protein
MTPDQPLSLAIAVLGSILCLILPRRWAIVPLALSICAYPSTLLVPPQAMSLSPQRIIALVLIARCLLQSSIRKEFHWRLVDSAAVLYFTLITVSLLLTQKPAEVINNRAGFFLSALVPFWCVRFLIIDRQSLYCLLKGWLCAAVPLACLGLYQMQTGKSPYFSIMQYGLLWGYVKDRITDKRLFLGVMRFRAFAPFLQFIMFGWFFAILVTPCTNLFWEKRKIFPWIIPWLFLPLGVITSISSGPMSGAAISFAIALAFPLRRYWKFAVGAVALAYLVTMFGSNRGLMEIIASFGTMDPLSSWYRVSLQRYTLSQGGMKGHWFAGYGEVPLVYAEFHDLCIHWIWLLVIHGVMGLVGFYSLVAASAWSLWKGKAKAQSTQDHWLLWTLMATLIASLLGMLLVTLFSEMYFIYHMFLAILANSDIIIGKSAGAGGGTSPGLRQVMVLVEQNGKKVAYRYALKPGQRLALVQPAPETSAH